MNNYKTALKEFLLELNSGLSDFLSTSEIELLSKIKTNDDLSTFISQNIKSLQRLNIIASELSKNLLGENSERVNEVLVKLVSWLLHWDDADIDYILSGQDSFFSHLSKDKFCSAREAVQSVEDNSVCISTGFGAIARCSIFFRTFRDVYKDTTRPKNLTWLSVSAQGGRAKVPMTIEELAVPGLLKKYICGHLETAKALLKLADKGGLELHTMPQGEYGFLLEAQAQGIFEIESKTGLGTFLDPAVGRGSLVKGYGNDECESEYIKSNGNSLTYSLPKIDYAFISASYADSDGNIYFENAALISESFDAALAVYNNGGKVFCSVQKIIEKEESKISIASEFIEKVIVNPDNEQIAGIPQKEFWREFTAKDSAYNVSEPDKLSILDNEGAFAAHHSPEETLSIVKLVNTIMGITPLRRPIDKLLARSAASLVEDLISKNYPEDKEYKNTASKALVNIGVGLPEEVSSILYKRNISERLVFTTEAGVYGGLPTPGIFFGAAVNPIAINKSSWMFHKYEKNLELTVLGFLQIDSFGNVNVSRKGSKASEFVGPGGFPNLTAHAKNIIFIGSWMQGGSVVLKNDKVQLLKKGKTKFVKELLEITFNAKAALEKKQNVYYITDFGTLKLTKQGLEIIQLNSGLDYEKDIKPNCDVEFIL